MLCLSQSLPTKRGFDGTPQGTVATVELTTTTCRCAGNTGCCSFGFESSLMGLCRSIHSRLPFQLPVGIGVHPYSATVRLVQRKYNPPFRRQINEVSHVHSDVLEKGVLGVKRHALDGLLNLLL